MLAVVASALIAHCNLADLNMVVHAMWYALLVLPGMFLVHELMPKVPLYKVKVTNLPWLSWRGGEIQTTLKADVHMDNVNYVKTDIHAIAFDVYFPNFDGTLHHIGHVRDKAHYKASTEYKTVNTTNIATPETPLWTMHARKTFKTHDDMHMRVPPKQMMKSMGHLLWQIFSGRGLISMPATGVAHVKASNSAKVTISMICDNELNVFTMNMEGRKCTLDKLATGWIHMDDEADRLRAHTLQLKPIEDGSILPEKIEALTPVLQKAIRQEQLDALFLV